MNLSKSFRKKPCMLKKTVSFSTRVSMYQGDFPWDVILFQEHFGNNVYNILHYISIVDHASQCQAEALNLSTAFFSLDSAERVHWRGPEALLKILQWRWWGLGCVDEWYSPRTHSPRWSEECESPHRWKGSWLLSGPLRTMGPSQLPSPKPMQHGKQTGEVKSVHSCKALASLGLQSKFHGWSLSVWLQSFREDRWKIWGGKFSINASSLFAVEKN